jgi:hypothetical protein
MLSSRLPHRLRSVRFARDFFTYVVQYYCYIIIVIIIVIIIIENVEVPASHNPMDLHCRLQFFLLIIVNLIGISTGYSLIRTRQKHLTSVAGNFRSVFIY